MKRPLNWKELCFAALKNGAEKRKTARHNAEEQKKLAQPGTKKISFDKGRMKVEFIEEGEVSQPSS